MRTFRGRHSTLRSLNCKFCGRRNTLGTYVAVQNSWQARYFVDREVKKISGKRSTLWILTCKFRGRRSTLCTWKRKEKEGERERARDRERDSETLIVIYRDKYIDT